MFIVVVPAKVEDRALRHPDAIWHQVRLRDPPALVGPVDLYDRSFLNDLRLVVDIKNEEPRLHGEGR